MALLLTVRCLVEESSLLLLCRSFKETIIAEPLASFFLNCSYNVLFVRMDF